MPLCYPTSASLSEQLRGTLPDQQGGHTESSGVGGSGDGTTDPSSDLTTATNPNDLLVGQTYSFDPEGVGSAADEQMQEAEHLQELTSRAQSQHEVSSDGTGSGTNASSPTDGDSQTITIYRGTAHGNEQRLQTETGYAMSDAAREAYRDAQSAGQSEDEALDAARAASQAADESQMQYWSSRDAYVQAHGEYGSGLKQISGTPRSMISFTTDPEIAGTQFAGPNGVVYQATVRPSDVFFQTLPNAAESEVLVLHMIQVEEIEMEDLP